MAENGRRPVTADLSPRLLCYFTKREEQRQHDIEQAWPTLQADIAGFIGRHRDHPVFAAVVAKLVRELAVAAFVRGTMWAAGVPVSELKQPADSVMLHQARETTRSMFELYPAWALLDGRTETEEADE